MKLQEKQKQQLSTTYFVGGHMFYCHRDSRSELALQIEQMLAKA
jgi:hypothetical protein